MKELNNNEVIQLIDGLTLGYEDSEQSLESAENHLNMIYKVAHSHRKDASCYNVHDDWRKEAVKLLKEYEKNGMC